MRLFILNLKRQPERREFMESQLSKLDLDFEFLDAVDGSSFIDKNRNVARTIGENSSKMVPGEIGCALSHIAIYKRMLADGISDCVVLEDDVTLPEDFASLLEMAAASRYEYVTFNYPAVGIIRDLLFKGEMRPYTFLRTIALMPVKSLMKAYEYILGELFPRGIVITLHRPLYLTGAYFLRRSAAEKLLPLTEPLLYTADRLVDVARKRADLNMGAYVPLSVIQASLPSTMEYSERRPST